MSRITFHAINGEAELSGCERAQAGVWARDLARSVLALDAYHTDAQRERDYLMSILPPDHHLRDVSDGPQFIRFFHRCGDFDLIIEGQLYNTFPMALNTLHLMGNDQLKLLARLHGQCEIHAWVDGPQRDWLAEIIERGLETGVYRQGMGWNEVATLLRADDDEPVATSFSVSAGFPNADLALLGGWQHDPALLAAKRAAQFKGWTADETPSGDDLEEYEDQFRADAFYELPDAEQWRLAVAGLRQQPTLELHPDVWDDYYFTPNFSAFDLRRRIVEAVNEGLPEREHIA